MTTHETKQTKATKQEWSLWDKEGEYVLTVWGKPSYRKIRKEFLKAGLLKGKRPQFCYDNGEAEDKIYIDLFFDKSDDAESYTLELY